MGKTEKIDLLRTIPCRSKHITTIREGEDIVLSFPRFKRSWIQRYFLPKGMSPDIRVTLEEHGAAVWMLINGRCTVGEIIEKLADHFDSETGYESRITTYILQLQKDGMVRLTVSD